MMDSLVVVASPCLTSQQAGGRHPGQRWACAAVGTEGLLNTIPAFVGIGTPNLRRVFWNNPPARVHVTFSLSFPTPPVRVRSTPPHRPARRSVPLYPGYQESSPGIPPCTWGEPRRLAPCGRAGRRSRNKPSVCRSPTCLYPKDYTFATLASSPSTPCLYRTRGGPCLPVGGESSFSAQPCP